MTTAAKWTAYSVLTLVAYFMLAAGNAASAAPTKGEIRSLIKDMVYEAHPECVYSKRHTVGDNMVCWDRFTNHLDGELNSLYKQVMAKFRFFDVKQGMIRDVQRKWIKHRDQECIFTDSTDGSIADQDCVALKIGLSLHYLTRLNNIELNRSGLPEIDRVISEYSLAVR